MKNNRLKQAKRKRAILQSKPVSMKEFLKRVGEIAASVGEAYYTVHCEITHQREGLPLVHQFRCYINPSRSAIGKSVEDALQKMRDVVSPAAIAEAKIQPEYVIVDGFPF